MRVRRTPLVGAVAATLLLLTTTTAWAQTDSCTGSIEFSQAATGTSQAWQASDDRLSGIATQTGDWSFYAPPSEVAGELDPAVALASFEIANDGGTWHCVKSSPDGPEPDIDTHSLVFRGSDGYDGLTAYVKVDWNTYPFGFSGFIADDDGPEDPTLAG